MASFDRFDICAAYSALEYDWNHGGWLQERPSNQRRKESIGVQLHRMGYKPSGDEAAGFHHLIYGENADNRAEIYVDALVRFGLAKEVRYDDDIAQYVREKYEPDWVRERFPLAAVEPKRSIVP